MHHQAQLRVVFVGGVGGLSPRDPYVLVFYSTLCSGIGLFSKKNLPFVDVMMWLSVLSGHT